MSAVKSPKALSLVMIAALAAILLIAGCGGSGGEVVSGQSPPANPPSKAVEPKTEAGSEAGTSEEAEGMSEEEGMSEGESGGAEAGGAGASEEVESGGEAEAEGGEAGAAAMAEGKTVFTTNCGSCHTLADAGTSGTIGPNLDELMPSESTVENQVINGGGPMPAFGNSGILESGEIKAVAEYVSSVAGK